MQDTSLSELQQQRQRYQNIITQHSYQPLQGKIHYHWRKAQQALLQRIQGLFTEEFQLLEVVKALNALQQVYSEKFIPVFYSYHTIAALLTNKSQVLSSLEQEYQKVVIGDSTYQQIALQLSLQESLFTTLVQQQRNREQSTETMEQLRKIHIVTIFKVNEWQKRVTARLGHPVFFYWSQVPYLITLAEYKPNSSLHIQNFKIHFQIHQIFQNTSSISDTQDLSKQCLNILRSQKGKELQMILNLPFFASVKTEKSNVISSSASAGNLGKLKLKVSTKPRRSGSIRPTQSLEGLGQEQLEIIKKFRSYKKLVLPSRSKLVNENQKKETELQKTLDAKLKDRISHLKQRIKVKERTNQSKDISLDLKPHEKTIRVLYQKQVDLKEDSLEKTKDIIDSLMKSSAVESPPRSKQLVKNDARDKIIKLQSQMNRLALINSKKKSEMKLKDSNLQTLKLQLMEKVRENHPANKRIRTSRATSLKIHQQKKQLQSQINPDPIKMQVEKEKQLLQSQQQSLKTTKEDVTNLVSKFQSNYSQYASEKHQNHLVLLQKQEAVTRLKQKLQKHSQIDNSIDDSLTQEVNRLKVQKKKEYQLQKQKINQISKTLSERVKEEEKKYQSLKQQEEQRQKLLKEQLQREVEAVRKTMQKETNELKQEIEQEQLKRKEYEEKIQREREENQKMVQEIREWSEKEKQLLMQLEEEKRKREQKQMEERLRRKAMVEAQLQQLQAKQLQIVNEYKSSNKNLMSMLQELKQKNYQLEHELHLN